MRVEIPSAARSMIANLSLTTTLHEHDGLC